MTLSSTIRRQGGAAVMTIPPTLLKLLHLEVGSQLELTVLDGELIARPVTQLSRKRYTLAELLKGSEHVAELNAETAWSRDGNPVGREIG